MMFENIGRICIVLGLILIVVGVAFYFGGKFIDFGKLPGDLKWTSGNTTVYFPIMTCIIISVVLTILGNIFFH